MSNVKNNVHIYFDPNDDFLRYQHYKNAVPETELLKIERFESNLIEFAKNKGCDEIKVKQLLPGHHIVFGAGVYPHGTIIPMQDEPRSLLVFHDIISINK